ncbi:MAG: hypothetical protein WKG06_24685 [Segetibacter sp.]
MLCNSFSIAILSAILTKPLNGFAQVSPSSFKIRGRIVDASGAAISGATPPYHPSP